MKKVPSKFKKTLKTQLKRLFRFSLWFFTGFAIGLFVPWYFYLQYVVNNLFVDYNWSIPSEIYAQELNLYNGKAIKLDEIKFNLSALGYKNKKQVQNLGQYSFNNNHFKIYSKGFQFLDSSEKPKIIEFDWKNNRISSLNRPIARLEPVLIGQFYSKKLENRHPIKLSKIPNTMVKGLQAVEDRNFKHHVGVDFLGVLRAMLRNLFAGRIVQGGSTITQQLVKNRLHYNKKSWLRKANEAIVAMMLENKFDKGKILENYFNEIYWGQSGSLAIHGIKQASFYYYSKQPQQLTIAEQAMLIGMVKGPSWYHPVKQKKRALKRRNIVLNSWYETSVINKKQWLKAKKAPLDVKINNSFHNQQYRDFIALVSNNLAKSFSKSQLNRHGLKIFTTLNPYYQEQLVRTLRWNTNKLAQSIQSSAVVSNAQTGEVLALKGAKERISLYNRAILSKRQIGSLIKPFVYLAALQLLPHFNMQDLIADKAIRIKTKKGQFWQPKNYDGKSLGMIAAETALIKSRNQATVNLGLKIGLNKFIQFMQKLGLTINRSKHPSLFLGVLELTPLEVNNLFLILSSNGKQQQLQAVKYVTDEQFQLIGKVQHRQKTRLNPQSIAQINQALHKVTTEGTAAKLNYHYGFKHVYGKTGTTNSGKNSWFVGFDKNILASFWVGKDNNTATKLTGSSGALVLWADFYKRIKPQ